MLRTPPASSAAPSRSKRLRLRLPFRMDKPLRCASRSASTDALARSASARPASPCLPACSSSSPCCASLVYPHAHRSRSRDEVRFVRSSRRSRVLRRRCVDQRRRTGSRHRRVRESELRRPSAGPRVRLRPLGRRVDACADAHATERRDVYQFRHARRPSAPTARCSLSRHPEPVQKSARSTSTPD